MNQPRSFVIVGAGKMGEAIVAGWLASSREPARSIAPENVLIANPGEARREHMKKTYDVTAVADAVEAPAADVVVLAVKPQVMGDVLKSLAACPVYQGGAEGPLFISIAAGLATSTIEKALPEGSRVVRVMPNMPLRIAEGASGVCGGAHASKDDVEYVSSLFGCLGSAVVVDEEDMDVVCALSGSGPAYVAAMVESLRDAAVAEGLEYDLAESLALQTVYGTAKLMVDEKLSPADCRVSICSPGGTTLAALDAMKEAGFDAVFSAGVKAAVKRSKELG